MYNVGTGKVFDWTDVALLAGIPKLDKKPNDCTNTSSFVPVKALVTSRPKESLQSAACSAFVDSRTQTYPTSNSQSHVDEKDNDDDDELQNDGARGDDHGSSSDDDIDQRLLYCPEEGCLKSYRKF